MSTLSGVNNVPPPDNNVPESVTRTLLFVKSE
jgi:hypothetical protein